MTGFGRTRGECSGLGYDYGFPHPLLRFGVGGYSFDVKLFKGSRNRLC